MHFASIDSFALLFCSNQYTSQDKTIVEKSSAYDRAQMAGERLGTSFRGTLLNFALVLLLNLKRRKSSSSSSRHIFLCCYRVQASYQVAVSFSSNSRVQASYQVAERSKGCITSLSLFSFRCLSSFSSDLFSSSLSWISCESIWLGLIFRSNHSDRQVSRHFFRWTKEIAYAEYYERALTNGILGIQRGREPGVMIYMLPLGRGVSKAVSYRGWGTKFDSFWCCYGTGIELFSKLGDSIDFEEEGKVPGIYITQFISTSQSGQILLNQKVEPPVAWNSLFQVFLTILSEEEGSGLQATLHFRVLLWSLLNGAKAVLNVQDLSLPNPEETVCSFIQPLKL